MFGASPATDSIFHGDRSFLTGAPLGTNGAQRPRELPGHGVCPGRARQRNPNPRAYLGRPNPAHGRGAEACLPGGDFYTLVAMSLGVLSGHGGSLGQGAYAAPQSMRAGMDLGPTVDWTPEGREYRQRFEEGLTSYLRYASQPNRPPVPPVGQWERDPALLEYQRAVRESSAHAPWIAQHLVTEGAILGRQADLRAGRHLVQGFRPSYVAGVGQIWVTPAAPPGYSFAERAQIGVPTWVTGAPLPEHIL